MSAPEGPDPYRPPGADLGDGRRATRDPGSVGKGVRVLLLLHLLQIPGVVVLAFAYLAISQLVYAIPAAIWFNRRGEADTVQGIGIAAGITALVNLACWGLVAVSF